MPLSADLVTANDMADYGYTEVAPEVLTRVSSKVRRVTGQTITGATSTASGWSPLVLPQFPVVSVTSVVDELGQTIDPAVWNLRGQILTGPICRGINDFEINHMRAPLSNRRPGWLTVVYESGWDVLPDELVELVCSIAARVSAGAGTAEAGLRARTVGGESVTFAAEALSLDLTDRELGALADYFPRLNRGPRTITMGSPW